MIFREKLYNASTAEERAGNVLESKLGDEVEEITVDSSIISVKYYYVKTPDDNWRKTTYYEQVDNLFSITYKVNDTTYRIDYIKENDTVTVPVYVPATGYDWSGWLNTIPTVMPANDVIIESTSTPINYTLTYVLDDVPVKYEVHHYNDVLTAYNPGEKPGYTFSGWTGFPQDNLMPANDLSLTGTYTANNAYVLTFLINSSVYSSSTYNEGATIITPADPTVATGYEWSGWVNLPTYMPANDTSVNSTITPKQYWLDYYVDSSLWKSLLYDYNESIVPQVYEAPEVSFSGWENEPLTMPAINHYSVYGSTSELLYELLFINGELVWAQYQLKKGELIPTHTVNKEGYTFTGWDPELPTFMPDSSITTYATFDINQYVLSFGVGNSDGTITTSSYTLDYNQYIDSSFYPQSSDPSLIYVTTTNTLKRMPARDYNIYGTFRQKDTAECTVSWYIDSSLIYSDTYGYDRWIESPVCTEPEYEYVWQSTSDEVQQTEFDRIHVPRYSTLSVYGTKVQNGEVPEPVYDSSLFGISLEQYGTSVEHPVVDFGYMCDEGPNTYASFHAAQSSGIPGSIYIRKPGGYTTNDIYHVMEEIDSSILATFKYQISTDGVNWTDAVNVEFDTDVENKTTENNIVYLPELSSKVYVRLALKSIAISTLSLNQITDGMYYSIWFDRFPSGANDIKPVFVLDNKQTNSKYQIFGNYDSFYSHLTEQLNTIFNVQFKMHGLLLSIANKICHAHNAYEHTAHNCITSGYRNYNGGHTVESFNRETCTIETVPVILATDVYSCCYAHRWSYCSALTSVSTLPATTLARSCYNSMFYGCTALTSAPTLPATTLATSCYLNMFGGCTALTSAPVLPATTLAVACYETMFKNCTALTSAPELPATTLANECYISMFYGCTALTSTPELPATTLALFCYANMFRDCTALISITTELPALTVPWQAYDLMFRNCTSLEESTIIRGTSYSYHACLFMFYGCSSLLHRALLPENYEATEDAFKDMYKGCTSLQE